MLKQSHCTGAASHGKHTAPVFQEIAMHDDIGADSIEEWGGDILPIKDDITEGHGG